MSRLDELRELYEKATPGEWFAGSGSWYDGVFYPEHETDGGTITTMDGKSVDWTDDCGAGMSDADTAFVVSHKNSWPAIERVLAAVEACVTLHPGLPPLTREKVQAVRDLVESWRAFEEGDG